MVRVFFMGLIFVGASSFSFATAPATKSNNNNNASVSLAKNINTILAQHPKMELTVADLVAANNNALKSSVAFKNILADANLNGFNVKSNGLSDEILELQAKYGERLNVMPQYLANIELLEGMDYWYGTRYLYGGTTKRGIDCSAFVRALFESVYNIALPRTAREQYGHSERISTTELKEGDLVFFNTRGGVSHVGIYLTNNKFVHSSSSKGVTISDLFEDYYITRYIGAGRIQGVQKTTPMSSPFLVKN